MALVVSEPLCVLVGRYILFRIESVHGISLDQDPEL